MGRQGNNRRSCRLPACALLMAAFLTQAQPLPSARFHDQWGQPFQVRDNAQLILVSVNRSSGSWVYRCLSSLDAEFIRDHGWLYVADVSQMPAWSVTSYALPEMKKYPWPVALVRDSADLKGWPIEPGQVTALELMAQKVVMKQSFDNEKSLHAYLCSRPERSDERMQSLCND